MKIWLPKLNYYTKRLASWQERLWREVNDTPFMGIIDNVSGRRYFEYATFGESGIQQSNSKLFEMNIQRAVSSFPYGTVSAAGVSDAAALDTNINRGRDDYYSDSTGTYYAYGYSVNGETYITTGANFGTMTTSTYTDGSSTSRTIKGVVYAEPSPATAYSDDLILSIDTTSVTNSDATWLDFTWDDTAGTPRTVTRSADLTSYTASLNGSTHWRDTAATYNYANLDTTTAFVLTTS